MISPQLLPLDASKCAVGDLVLCRAIVDHMDGEPAAQIAEHAEALDRFASGPHPDLLQAVSRQICPQGAGGLERLDRGADDFKSADRAVAGHKST